MAVLDAFIKLPQRPHLAKEARTSQGPRGGKAARGRDKQAGETNNNVWRRDGKEETDLGGTGRAGDGGAEASVAEARESFSETREGKASGAWSRRWRWRWRTDDRDKWRRRVGRGTTRSGGGSRGRRGHVTNLGHHSIHFFPLINHDEIFETLRIYLLVYLVYSLRP